ncbi:sushi, von Willebrand factor type A, EGF and pentraxin domain-containing protein 1-like isoform X2 [Neocloeon triangulifer]|uniref:sushi, von Willebrand factor type A, EGF and pentraxin domain-containing protein 1-like isoform X2 n=1 Tax=Neocloeon triangulifer TaxID=2078957 RepID=UPI00286FA0FC|nr:sushi, von Willebrand factor type A, EGF and pentraxin domain-containing protein 1-like isoform X2 [Neocloeon triangulifer]
MKNTKVLLLAILCLSQNATSTENKELKPDKRFVDGGWNEVVRKGSAAATRVEAQGAILREKVQRLLGSGGPVDVVFLIDASSSVGPDNFGGELRLVRKVLAGLQVSAHRTRVAVVSFADDAVTHVDTIGEPPPAFARNFRHKCFLLENALPSVRYKGGATFTLGALNEAQRILRRSREGTSRAVFLLTDGYSNGGDPRGAAQVIREELSAEIFTFGVRNGNTQELLEMASSPNHTFVLSSFEQFAALARRAFHRDLKAEDAFEVQDDPSCSALCDGSSCCDQSAVCTCNIATGRSTCLCPPGHFGSGRPGDCHRCPSGTFGAEEVLQPGGVLVSLRCSPCPDPNQETEEGATSVHECKCKNGFTSTTDSLQCQVSECPELRAPKFGKLVRSTCPRVFNAACGVTCETGRQLVGSSIRLCTSNGTWSGVPAACRKKKCPELRAPSDGWIRCNGPAEVDARCELGCRDTFTLLGSTFRNCLAIGMWDGLPTTCREVKCPAIELPKSVSISPSNCSQEKQKIGQVCRLSCTQPGYQLRGASKRKCGEFGRWSGSRIRCVDVEPPKIDCPKDKFEFHTDPDADFATVALSLPEIEDNSNDRVRIHITPTVHLHSGQIPLGVTSIAIQATDLAGNFATCAFNISVIDKQPPRVESCESPSPFLVPSHIHAVDITWVAPSFTDNSGLDLKVFASHESGSLFTPGVHNVNYVAYDSSGNNASCDMTIIVQKTECEGPLNGDKVCNGSVCTLSCDEGYDIAFSTNDFCQSLTNGSYPDCTIIDLPDSIEQDFGIDSEEGECDEEQSNDLNDLLAGAVRMACDDEFYCHLEKVSKCTDAETDIKDIEEQESNAISLRVRRQTTKPTRSKGRKGSQEFTISGNHSYEFRIKIIGKVKVASKGLRAALGTVRAVLTSGSVTTSQRLPALELKFSEARLGCPAGSVLRLNDLCVQCPRGTFLPAGHRECVVCPAGNFQPRPGQQKCESCPRGTSTAPSILPTKKQHCIDVCPAGLWSRNGLAPCSRCPIGSYQTQPGQQGCIPCPEGYSTAHKGATSPNSCKGLCSENWISRNGLEPCTACPEGFKQTLRGQRVCEHESCAGNGGRCLLPPLYATHPCVRQRPCGRTAACVPASTTAHSYLCICPDGWTGDFCEELDEDPCLSEPCANGATCLRSRDKFICHCPSGFSGDFCEEDVNECESNPCENLGACVDLAGSFRCECVPGYGGERCERLESACQALQPCPADATCQDEGPDFRCHCPRGRDGNRCLQVVDPCEKLLCKNGGTCLPEPTTETGVSLRASCACREPFFGETCEKGRGACRNLPCKNGGVCSLVHATPGYRCECPKNFAGDNCSVALLDDGVLQFQNAGNLRDYVLKENAINVSLTEFTLCSWLRTRDTINYGTPLSYATHVQDNTLALTDYSGFVVYINGERVVTDVSANDGMWHLVCLLWSSQNGSWSLYKDGVQAEGGHGLATSTSIPGGGTLVLGQEQDTPGGSFNSEQSFLGRLGPTAMWPTLLSKAQLAAIFNDCSSTIGAATDSQLRDFSVNAPALWSWRETLAGIKGNLQLEPPAFCSGCPELPTLANGRVSTNGSHASVVATFTCDLGFRLSGARSAVCTKRGTWQLIQGHAPSCFRINCGTPEPLENGLVLGDSYDFGAVLLYECFPGYEMMEGDERRECQDTGRWSGRQPFCTEIKCKLPVVVHGRLHHFGSSEDLGVDQKTALAGEQIEVVCEGERSLQGEALLTCLESGEWDYRAPTCFSICDSSPGEIANSKPVLVLGAKARFQCLPGYTIVGNPLVECKGERWGEAPECQAQVRWTCETAPLIENGLLVSLVGGIATYVCDEGFNMLHHDFLRCVGGEWSPEAPRCQAAGCPPLAPLEKGSVRVKGYTKGGVAEHACDAGFQLVGPRLRKCLGLKWSAFPPYCKPIVT